MSNNKINFIFVLMLIGIFIMSISAANEHGNQNDMDNSEITCKKNKEFPKIESNLLKEYSDIFQPLFQDNDIIKVVIILNSSNEFYRQSLEDNGAIIEAVYDNHLQATVPVSELPAISELPFVKYIRSPYKPFMDEISEGVKIINAGILHDEGFNGQGVKIAILDAGFAGYQSRLGTELPDTVIINSFCEGGINSGGQSHGTAVAEVVYDTAPDASMYLINFDTDINFSQAVNYAISQDVDIISMSMGWPAGPFNGTGLQNEIVDTATASGIIWVNSAGNFAEKHWEGIFNDPDGNEIHNFFNDDETMSIVILSGGSGNVGIYLSWDDWPESDQDYDLYLFSNTGELLTSSDSVQNGTQEPVEIISKGYYEPGTYHLKIKKYNATRAVNFELYSYYQKLEYNVAVSSLCIPADAQKAIVAGATYWSNDALESFSSQGPTNDGRIKPDVVAPDGVFTSVPGLLSFYGTSASAPHVAGASALLLQVNPDLSPDQLKQALESGCIDLGEPGKDNQSGAGRIDVYTSYQLTSPPNKSVLIIDDDNDINFEDDQSVDIFNSTFENLGYDVRIEESANTSNSTWGDYDILVWSCGDDFTPIYDPQYKEMLIDYVTSGGNLILESGSIATWIDRFGDQIIDMKFRNIVLHATSDWVYCDAGNLTLSTQHPTATTPNLLPVTMNFTSTDPGDDSSDADAVRILPNATGIYNWSGINYEGKPMNINAFGIITYDDDAHKNNGGQIIYYAFDIDDIDDPDVQRKLIENSENWLRKNVIIPPEIIGFSPSFPVIDTAPATRTFNITVDQILNVTWYFNKALLQQDNLTTAANATITTELNGVHNVTAIAKNENGTAMQKWDWNVTLDQDILSYYRRDIENQNLIAGGSTNVTVTLMSNVTQALSLIETVPTGWTLTPVLDDADVFNTNEWAWFNAAEGVTKTVIYQLDVPSTTFSGTYNITGNITNSSGIIAGVSGESIIHIYTTSSVINISCVTVDVNDTVVVPVTIANITNIQQITLDLVYDPDVAAILNITASDTIPSSTITYTLGSGTAAIKVVYLENITVTSPTPFINIIYKTGEYNATTALEMQNVEFINDSGSHAPDMIINGSLIVCIKGDFNYNNKVDIGDATKVAFMVAGKVPGDPRADFNNNARIDIGDAAKIQSYLAGKISEL